MKLNQFALVLLLSCYLGGVVCAGQVDPNKTGGSQVKPTKPRTVGGTSMGHRPPAQRATAAKPTTSVNRAPARASTRTAANAPRSATVRPAPQIPVSDPDAFTVGVNEQTRQASSTDEASAKGKEMVWLIKSTKVYYHSGDKEYGTTHDGSFASEADAKAAGYRPATH